MTILEMFRLDDQVAVVTGASRGLGFAMAAALAEAGADIVGISTGLENLSGAQRAVTDQGRRFHGIACDLSDREVADSMVAEALDAFGAVNILVNNAGIIRRSPAREHGDEDWDAVIETNLSSVFRMCRAFGGKMLDKGYGRVINIASLLSFSGGITVPSYASSKAGVMVLTQSLANEWSSENVTVNAIAPGYFETDNTSAVRADETRYRQILERIPAGRWGQPMDLKGAVVFLASPASAYITGHTLAVDGGFLGR